MSEMRLESLLCSETSRFILENQLHLPLILNTYDPIVKSFVTYRELSTGNQLTLNNP